MPGPSGNKLNDGFPTTITFALTPTVSFWEKQVTPPGFDGGGPNDTTTMRNSVWRTMQPKKLKSMTSMTLRAAYDPKVLNDINTIVNLVQLITVTFPDGSTWVFYGWLNSFKPDRVIEGSQPEAEVEIICGNQTAGGVETAPSYTQPTSTTSTTTTTTP